MYTSDVSGFRGREVLSEPPLLSELEELRGLEEAFQRAVKVQFTLSKPHTLTPKR
jgi:hypothetical protein